MESSTSPQPNIPPHVRKGVLVAAILIVVAALLYFATPSPAYLGRVIEAEVVGCTTPMVVLPAAIDRWDASIAKTPAAAPRAGWKEDVVQQAKTDSAVVLDMLVHRERSVFENRKPWNNGSAQPAAWNVVGETKRYYARDGGSECGNHVIGKRQTYFPFSEGEPAGAWPPAALPNFLDMQILGPVPEKYRVLPGDAG